MNAGYLGFAASRRDARHYVAAAWIEGRAAKGSNFRTDGKTLWSYAHIVGVTADDGSKNAYDCHYSMTTAKQTGPAKAMADAVIPCASCNRG